jgi:hypothetical protein
MTGILLIQEIGASVPTTKGKGNLKKEMTWAAALVYLTRGGPLEEASALLPVAADDSVHLSFNVGPIIPEGKTLQVANLTGGSVNYFVSGYLLK